MQKNLLLVLALFLSLGAWAQVPYPTQPAPEYYNRVKTLCASNIPSAEQLKALKPGGLPPNLLDSLRKYDWYEVSSYHYSTNEYSSYYTEIGKAESSGLNVQLPFRRFLANKVIYEMSLNHTAKDPAKVLTTTFDEQTAQKLVEVRTAQGGGTYMVTEIFGEKESQQIISYQNGILVMEIKENPNANNLRKYRIAYRAVPRSF